MPSSRAIQVQHLTPLPHTHPPPPPPPPPPLWGAQDKMYSGNCAFNPSSYSSSP